MLLSLLNTILLLFFIYVVFTLSTKYQRWKKVGVEKKYGIYAQGGEWFFLKKLVMMCILLARWLRDWYKEGIFRHPLYDQELARKWRKSEAPQDLKSDPFAVESVYFYGGNDQGLSFILRFARRQEREGELWVLLRLPDGRYFEHQMSPNTTIVNCHPNRLQADGLKIFCEEPMSRWRLMFSGYLKESGKHNSFTAVTLNTCFRAFTNPFDVDKDLSYRLLAEGIAREEWSVNFFSRLENDHDDQVHLEQWGAYTGELQVEDEHFQLSLRGYRDHSYGTRNWENYYRYAAHFAHFEDGSVVSVGAVSLGKTLTQIRYGYYYTPYGAKWPISSHNFNLWEHGEANRPEDRYQIKFRANGKKFLLHVASDRNVRFLVGKKNESLIFERFTKYKLNNRQGKGVSEYCYRNFAGARPERLQSLPLLCDRPLTASDARPLTLGLSEELCQSSRLTGGKGSQLALLTHVDGAEVPGGFVVTTAAYLHFLKSQPSLSAAVKRLVNSRRAGVEVIEEASVKELQDLITAEHFPQDLSDEINDAASRSFGEQFRSQRFAVRSSAVGEDGEEASGAGQMETFLGVSGAELCDAVARCWRSQFSVVAVDYRWRHGLVLDPEMAAVVQLMVPAESAGVLFTQHPVTGFANRLTIDANFGLGESVVSSTCEPDTFEIIRYTDERYEIATRKIGQKAMKIEMKGDSGVETREVGDERHQAAISDDVILRLAKLGRLIEKRFGSPRDIEWALSGDKIFLLQARAITTTDLLGEDLLHEFDGSLSHDREVLTTANIGEMMPMAVTPLTNVLFGHAVDVAIQDGLAVSGLLSEVNHVRRVTPSFTGHLFINIHSMSCLSELHIAGAQLKMLYISLFGRVLESPSIAQLRYYNGQTGYLKRLKNMISNTITLRILAPYRTRCWEKKLADGYNIRPRFVARDQLEAIDEKLDDYYKCWRDTTRNSGNSAIGSMIVMNIIGEGTGWNNEFYSKVAAILSSCEEVFSADVPFAIRSLTTEISNSEDRDQVLEMSDAELVEWLLSTKSGKAGDAFRKFLNRHGHRGVREAEFREVPWRRSPEKVASVVRALLKAGPVVREPQEIIDVERALEMLPTNNFNPLKRWILRKVIKMARKGVGLREWGKSIAIQFGDVFKDAFLHLSDLMHREGVIPDKDLIYFFSYEELHRLVAGGNARLVAKACRRRQVHKEQMHLQYPELSEGMPKPEKEDTEQEEASSLSSDLTLSGMPVGRGEVTGKARVICSLEEAAGIETGDILVVPYTDVGWSPYFPLISGLVTEKGGLLSHGAVVAREYGLPCIVGCRHATTYFKTGDTVRVDGTRGTVHRLTS